jgi:hypothetical protein
LISYAKNLHENNPLHAHGYRYQEFPTTAGVVSTRKPLHKSIFIDIYRSLKNKHIDYINTYKKNDMLKASKKRAYATLAASQVKEQEKNRTIFCPARREKEA